jgi:hypothetical protein
MLSRSDSRPGLVLDVGGVSDTVYKPPGDQGMEMG